MRLTALTRIARTSLALLLAARPSARAATPSDASATTLAQIKDERVLGEALHRIAHDPEVTVADPAVRGAALAVLSEGVRQWRDRAYDQALANFLDSYARLGTPRALPPIAAILRDMGRLADAANTYQRYLSDPANRGERVPEIQDLLKRLDEQLTVLTVRVAPAGAELSIDGGPFVAVGDALVTRVSAGLHLVRIRSDQHSDERTIHGFEGEAKDIALQVTADARATTAPERVEGWLITGTHYGAGDARGRARTVLGATDRAVIAAIGPRDEAVDHIEPAPVHPEHDRATELGAIGAIRIDGKGRGFAGAVGLSVSHGPLDVELMVLRSEELGGYAGVRYRVRQGLLRPYLAAGVPSFVFDEQEQSSVLGSPVSPELTTRLAVGVRIALGVELRLHRHISIYGDVGYEHFFFTGERFEDDLLVPTVAMVGRL